MERKMKRAWQRKTAAVAAAMLTMSFGSITHAMPQSDIVRSGEATIQRSDDNKSMEINQSTKRAAIDWKNFDIANDERVNFRQPDAQSIVLNRVTGDAKSVIDGQLTGNGQVFVVNPNGVPFGQNASVDVGSLVASTARVSDAAMAGFGTSTGDVSLAADDANTSASVINEGQIKAEGGLVALHAASVANNGTITNAGGRIALAAAKTITLSADTAGKINFDVDGKLAKASTLNTGVLKADGGYVVMTAKQAGDVMSTVVNNTGTIEARTLRKDEKGQILLDGGDTGIVAVNGTLDASGVEAGQSAGSIKAIGAETHVKDGAALLARGQVDGGLIETSGDYLDVADAANIDTSAATGKMGTWLLDPTEVIIASRDSDAYKNAKNKVDIDKDASTYTRDTSVISTESLVNRLKTNNVTIEAIDLANHMADITLASALNVDTTKEGGSTLTLLADNDIIIDAAIHANSPLNIVLKGDNDNNGNGDGKGGVHINADIYTGGGYFETGANSATYFSAAQDILSSSNAPISRTIDTNGGNVNIQNEALLQLNGGTLNINTKGGHVTFAKNITSMNNYVAFMDFDYASYLDEMRKGNTSATKTKQAEAWENLLREIYGKTYINDMGKEVVFEAKGVDSKTVAFDELSYAQKSEISTELAQVWEVANMTASIGNPNDDKLGKNINHSHLVTITDQYENTAAMANAVKIGNNTVEYFTGGKDVTDPPTNGGAGRTFSWVVGPEAGNGFYKTTGTGTGNAVNGSYTNWVHGVTHWGGTYEEPNNGDGKIRQPYVAVGWTDKNGWDDVQNHQGQTVHGFIRETELPNSALAIDTNGGTVTVGGHIGSSEGTAIRNLDIKNAGNVDITGSIYVHDNNTYTGVVPETGKVSIESAGTIKTGQITADRDVTMHGAGNVEIGGKIRTGSGSVALASGQDILVHGIEADKHIELTSTGEAGMIMLGDNAEGGGVLRTSSSDQDAVVIDVRGANGSFHNETSAADAVKTGEGGSWKIYSSSPDRNTFGKNLDSHTNAQWNATSSTYSASKNAGNKYIFQVQPTLHIKIDDKTKVYGEEFDPVNFSSTILGATFTGRDGKEYGVDDESFKLAFDEGNFADRFSGTIAYSSDGVSAKKTRTGGTILADDKQKAGYSIDASVKDFSSADGYGIAPVQSGTLAILKRKATITGTGEQTYGNSTLTKWEISQQAKDDANHEGFVNGDRINWNVTNPVIDSDSTYAASQKGRATADADTYQNAIAVDKDAILAANGDVSANYDLTFENTLKVNKAKLSIHTDDINTMYGTVKTATTTVDGLTNGDLVSGFTFDYGDYGGAYLDNNTRTNAAGRYTFKTSYADPDFLKNYEVTNNDATVTITMPQQKPDIDHNTTTNLTGSASYTNSLGSHGIPGVDRVAGLASAELPFFKLAGGKVTNYGTYDVTADPQNVVLEPSGKRLPQPDQPKTQYREYTKNLVTSFGTGSFRLVYDGSIFHISPLDAAARSLLTAGDATKNVELSAQALHTGFNEMGLMLEDLDAVYVHFDKTA